MFPWITLTINRLLKTYSHKFIKLSSIISPLYSSWLSLIFPDWKVKKHWIYQIRKKKKSIWLIFIHLFLASTKKSYLSNSQILATWNSSTSNDIVPWIGEKNYTLEQSSNSFPEKICMSGCLSEIHSKVLVFSNPGDNIQFLVKLRDRFVPLFLHILGPCLLD